MCCDKVSLISLILPLFKVKMLEKNFQGVMTYREVPRSYVILTMQDWHTGERHADCCTEKEDSRFLLQLLTPSLLTTGTRLRRTEPPPGQDDHDEKDMEGQRGSVYMPAIFCFSRSRPQCHIL
jgi:hypothetical protein